MGSLRSMARKIKAGRRKAALALAYAQYAEREERAGREVLSKREWRQRVADGKFEIVNGE